MSKSMNNSNKVRSEPPSWLAKRLKELDEKLVASGLTVVDMEPPTDTRQFVATFHNPSQTKSANVESSKHSGTNVKGELDWDEAMMVIAQNLVDRVLPKKESEAIRELLSVDPKASLLALINVAPSLEDCMWSIAQEKFKCFEIVSDDECGSECGPWRTVVYDACGVWVVESLERDLVYFDNESDAVSQAYDYSHSCVISASETVSKYRKPKK